MKLLFRNLILALAFIALAWIVDSAIDTVFFHEGTFLDILFGDVPPVELFMRVSGAVAILAFATVISFLSARTNAAQEALRESEARFREYVDNAPDAIFVANAKGQYIDANEGAALLTGYSIQELLTLSIPDLSPPEGLEETVRSFAKLQESGKVSTEFTLLRKDGSTAPTSLDAVRLPGDRYMAFCADITERKRAEAGRESLRAFMQAVIDGLPESIMVLNLDYSIALANRQAREAAEGEDPVAGGLRCHQLSHHSASPCAGGDHVCPLAEVLATKASVSVEHIHPDAEGHRHYVEVTASPILDEEGEVVQVIESCRDITERKQIEDALRESEKRYRGLFNGSQDALMTLSPPSWNFDSCNAATIAMFGARDEAAFLAQAPWQYSPERQPDGRDSGEKAQEMIGTAMRKGSHSFEWTHRRTDGADFPATVLLTRTEVAGETLLQATVRDITERKQMERDLEESEERHRTLVQNYPGIAYRTDLERWTPTLFEGDVENITGYSSEEFISGEVRWDQMVHPDDLQSLQDETLLERLRTEPDFLWVRTYRIVRKDGGLRWVHDSLQGLPSEPGIPQLAQGFLYDTTERTRLEMELLSSERRFRDVTGATSDWIWEVDAQGRYTYCSQHVTRVLGYTPEELLGKSPFDLMSEEDAARHREIFAGVLAKRLPIVDVENWNLAKDGRDVCLLTNCLPMFDANGELIGYRGADKDITERKRLESELSSSRDRLRKLSAHLGEVREEERRLLARELHDEVGQDLTAMRWDLDTLKEGPAEGPDSFAERVRSMIEIVNDAVIRVNRMSHELRSPILELLGIGEAIQAHAEEIQERTGLEIGLDLELGELESSTERDTSILRIFQEILSNVIRHAEAHRAEVSASVLGGNVVLEVRDDGVGIGQEQLRDEGSFGLTGMRERAVLVGGTVEIRRDPGGGTSVKAVIPVESA